MSIAKIYVARFYPALINPHKVNEAEPGWRFAYIYEHIESFLLLVTILKGFAIIFHFLDLQKEQEKWKILPYLS